jgi:ABC-2 type transport system ATP-binding protein
MAEPDRSATTPWDTVVELKGVWKVYKQTQRGENLGEIVRNLVRPRIRQVEALRGIDLRIERGETVAYAGPNGAGKSTTVKLLSSLLAPDAGAVRVLGMDPVRDRVRYVGHIGVVFGQRTELWWDQPVAASFEWKRVVWDIPRDRYERMRGLVRELLGLDEFMKSLARELSLGQKMRAELGLALLHEPEILFLDEPTIGLDVLAKRHILSFIKDLSRTRKVTVMITSHDMSDLEELAGRIVMLHRGNIAYDGDFTRLRRQFADRRRLLVETDVVEAPTIAGATLVESAEGRHEYVFDAGKVTVADLLAQLATRVQVRDVETHRAPIDDVIADIFEAWQGKDGRAPLS